MHSILTTYATVFPAVLIYPGHKLFVLAVVLTIRVTVG